jgi:hypothetical protein
VKRLRPPPFQHRKRINCTIGFGSGRKPLEGSISFCEQGNFGDRTMAVETTFIPSPHSSLIGGSWQVLHKLHQIFSTSQSDRTNERNKPIVIIRFCFQLMDGICLISEVNQKARSMFLQKGATWSIQHNE